MREVINLNDVNSVKLLEYRDEKIPRKALKSIREKAQLLDKKISKIGWLIAFYIKTSDNVSTYCIVFENEGAAIMFFEKKILEWDINKPFIEVDTYMLGSQVLNLVK